jgi:hypothetical protein
MEINKNELNEKIKKWDEALKSYALPSWDELPELNSKNNTNSKKTLSGDAPEIKD